MGLKLGSHWLGVVVKDRGTGAEVCGAEAVFYDTTPDEEMLQSLMPDAASYKGRLPHNTLPPPIPRKVGGARW